MSTKKYKYTYIQGQEKPFRCDFANCGKCFTTEGGLILHYRSHVKKEKPAPPAGGCDHSWRLLSDSVTLEKQAIKAGYTRVCSICLEVEK
jgi:hypothetical protein